MNLIDISIIKREVAVNSDLTSTYNYNVADEIAVISRIVDLCKRKNIPFKFCWFETNEIYNTESYYEEHNEYMDKSGIDTVRKFKKMFGVSNDDFVIFFDDNVRLSNIEKYGHRFYTLPWFMYISRYLHEYLNLERNTKWLPRTRPLYTPGKVYKWERLLVLEALRKLGLLEQGRSLYAFKFTESMTKITGYNNKLHEACNHTSFYSEKFTNKYMEIVEQLQPYEKNLDVDLNGSIQSQSDFHYAGYPYDKQIYTDTGFSIITETTPFYDSNHCAHPFVTEKTYRAIINCHPFMSIYRTSHMNEYLQSLGFYTFDEYIDVNWNVVKNTDIVRNFQIGDGNTVLINEYCKQIDSFSKNCHAHTEDISKMVRHNYNRMIEITDNVRNDVDKINIIDFDNEINDIVYVPLHDRMMRQTYRNPDGNRKNLHKQSLYSQINLSEHP